MSSDTGTADEGQTSELSIIPESVGVWLKRGSIALGVLVLGLILWLVFGPKRDPFPLTGVKVAGQEVEHVVQFRTVHSNGEIEIGEQGHWEGSLMIDEDWFDVPEESWGYEEISDWVMEHASPDADTERVGSLIPLVTETGIPLGSYARTADRAAALVDPDADGIVDLMVVRQPRVDDSETWLPATTEVSFMAQGSDQILVARPGPGTELLDRYVSGSIRTAVCDTYGKTAAYPTHDANEAPEDELDPDNLPDEKMVIWCQPPVATAEPVPLEGVEIPSHGQLEDVEDVATADEVSMPRGEHGEGFLTGVQQVSPRVSLASFRSRQAERGPSAVPVQSGGSGACEAAQEKLKEAKARLEAIKKAKSAHGLAQSRSAREASGKLMDKYGKGIIFHPRGDLAGDFLGDVGKANDPWDVIIAAQEFVVKAIQEMVEALQGDCGDPCSDNNFGAKDCEDKEDPEDTGGSITGKGDPHLRTIDGVDYDFQGVGEWTLARGTDLEVQARFEPVGTGSRASITTALAARLPGTDQIVGLYGDQQDRGDGWVLWLDDKAFLIPQGTTRLGDYVVSTNVSWDSAGGGSGVAISAGSDEILVVRNFSPRGGPARAFSVYPGSAELTGGLGGTNDGDGSNDFVLADGTDPFGGLPREHEDLYGEYGDSWRVKTVAESLFQYALGEGPDTFYDPLAPAGTGTLEDLTQEELERAVSICKANGVVAEPGLSDCAYDVGVTLDEAWAQGYRAGWNGNGSLALPNGQVQDLGALMELGSVTLWEAADFEVVANLAVAEVVGVEVPVVRGLKVTTGSTTKVIWPGWGEVPDEIELSAGATLVLHPSGLQGLAPELVGEVPGLNGLAVEEGTEHSPAVPDNPQSGVPQLDFQQVQSWSDSWLSPEEFQ